MAVTSLINRLCGANRSILHQKRILMDAISNTHGKEKAIQMYQTVCPIVKASIGQHMRHSMDHIEFAIVQKPNIHYDRRQRSKEEETDWTVMERRIQTVDNKLEELSNLNLANTPVVAYFMLSADSPEYDLPSTLYRELGFCAHHAIHHMALLNILATTIAQLPDNSLPHDFGRAPSTVKHDISTPYSQN